MSWWLGYGITRAVGDLVARSQHTSRNPGEDYILPDERARQAACAALAAQEDLDVDKVEVRVLSGALTLLGSVPSDAARARAEELCAGIAGVSSVENQLTVR